TSAARDWGACLGVAGGGAGGWKGRTLASTSAGGGVGKAASSVGPPSWGFSQRTPPPPQASACLTKSIGCRSTANSGLPRKTICSHLICPSVLFLMITTLIGRLYFTAVTKSAISIEKPPSPTKATT